MSAHDHSNSAQSHSHDPHDHAHHHADMGSADSRRRVAIAALLTGGFMFAEVIGGVISGSLALLADAAHMLTDSGSLALAWLGYKLGERPADEARSYGFARMKILAAFTNGILLVLLALWIISEAIQRLMAPPEVMGNVLLMVATGGLAVNLIAFAILHGGSKEDLNMRGAMWHVVGDLLGSVAAIGAAIIILATGWMPIDPILSVLVALLVGWAGISIARKSGHILLEGTPPGIDPEAITADLNTSIDNIVKAHHLHVWSLTENKPLVTLEVEARPGACLETIRRAVKARLSEAFDLPHVTVEIVSEPDET